MSLNNNRLFLLYLIVRSPGSTSSTSVMGDNEKWVSPYAGKQKFYYGSSSCNAWVNDLCHKANIEKERKTRDPYLTEKNLEGHETQKKKQIITPRDDYANNTATYAVEVGLMPSARSTTSVLGKKLRKSRKVQQLIQNNFGEAFHELQEKLDEAVKGRKESNEKLKMLVKLCGEVREERAAAVGRGKKQ